MRFILVQGVRESRDIYVAISIIITYLLLRNIVLLNVGNNKG